MIYESIPKGTVKQNKISYHYVPKAKVELMRMMLDYGYDPTKLPAMNDNTISVGAYQMRRSTFTNLEKLYPKNLSITYEKTLCNLKNQSLSAGVMLFDLMIYFQKNIYDDEKLKQQFTDADIHGKRRFISSVCAGMFNSGPSDVEHVFETRTLKRVYKSLEEMRVAFIKDLFDERGTISAPYAEYMGDLYFEVERKNESLKSPSSKSAPKSMALAYEIADTDALAVSDTFKLPAPKPASPASKTKTAEPITAQPIAKVKPVIGQPGRLLFRVDRKTGYYTFTLPKDWKEQDLSVLLESPASLTEVKQFNETKNIKPGDVVFIPVHLMKPELRDGQFATVYISGQITDEKLDEIYDKYCKHGRKNIKMIELYSECEKGASAVWVRIPAGALKDKYLFTAQNE